jgi:hypothetical protein
MLAEKGDKRVAVGVRCSVYYSCGCAAAILFIYLSPRSAFGMSDDHFLGVLIAASDSAQLFSVVNAMLAICMLVRFPRARDSPWLWLAIASPLFAMLVTPAFQSA